MGEKQEYSQLKISTRVMFDELVKQNVPVRIINSVSNLLEFVDSAGEKRLLFSTSSDRSSAVGQNIASNKSKTAIIAQELKIPIPPTKVCRTFGEVLDFFEQYKHVVLKPVSSDGGSGVTTQITSRIKLQAGYDFAREFGHKVIIQQHIYGSDVRLLIIAGKLRSAVRRESASVVGNGSSNLQELIYLANTSNERSAHSMSAMDLIDVKSAETYLQEKIKSIPAKNEVVTVVGPANLSLGGTAHEATHLVTTAMIADAEKISDKLRLGICGVDMMWNRETNEYYLIEVNATPGVNMHNDPFWGTSSDAIKRYVEWLVKV